MTGERIHRIDILHTFELGHPEIDAQHRTLVDTLNEIGDAIETGALDVCHKLFDSLIDTARRHFADEEALLRQVGFPRAEHHASYHRELIARATAVACLCKESAALDELRNCFRELVNFLIDDIVAGDMDFKSFLEETGFTRR
jgi:hemerythrin